MQYIVVESEIFTKRIIVEANTEIEALDKCYNALCDGTERQVQAIAIDYFKTTSDIEFSVECKADEKYIEANKYNLDYLR